MNWPRIILDGLSMSLLFNAAAGLNMLFCRRMYNERYENRVSARHLWASALRRMRLPDAQPL